MADGGDPIPLDLPSGVVKTVSDNAAAGRYVDAVNMRFWNGKAEKIGGWTKYIDGATEGVVHGALAWLSSVSDRLLALGTYIRAYSCLDTLDDITPLRTTGTLATDPFAVTDTETTVTVTHTLHGIGENGAYVSFSGATAGGGITLDGEYFATYVDANSYTVESATPATSTDSAFGGAAVDYEYAIDAGLADSVYGLGVGVGPVGAGTVGTPRTSGGILREMRTWFFDTFGTELLVHPSGGSLYMWDQPNADDRALAISNAPASARASFVTAERMIVALGTTTPMTMAWCDRDDNTVWTPAEDNTANVRTLQTGNRLVAGTRFPGGGGQVFWSDLAIYGMQFIGSTSGVYSTPVLAYDAGLIGPTAYEVTRDLIVWMTPNLEVMTYAGIVAKAPNFQDIRDYIISLFDTDKADKVTCGQTPDFSEIWFHYVSVNSPDGEPDRYFKANTTDWSWTEGELGRSAHVRFPTAGGAIIMTGPDQYIYQHEVGKNADGSALPWSLKMARLTLSNGGVEADVNGFIPDFERQVGNVYIDVSMYERPQSTTALDEQQIISEEDAEIVDIVTGGRYAVIEFSGTSLNCDVRFGVPLLDVEPAGRSR